MLRETVEHSFKPARQKPISRQIKDHDETNYPEALKKLLQGKGNVLSINSAATGLFKRCIKNH